MKTNKLKFSLLLLLCSSCLFAQQEAKHWHFGNKAGIVFPFTGSGIPTALSNSALTTEEGCASISNANGQLLFYTDGTLVYDRNNNLMPGIIGAGNGLKGNSTSTQSAIIVPKPGSVGQYFYIFTVGGLGVGALCHSLVDMTLNGGNGDVVPGATNKNVQMKTGVYEKVAAYKDLSGNFWVIAHDNSSKNFLEYKVTNAGVQPLVATIPIGTFNPSQYNFIGYLKFSPDGSKLAMATFSEHTIEVFNFNVGTGAITLLGTSGVTLTDAVNHFYAYGIEFSPNNQYLYTTGAGSSSLGKVSYLNQYDLNNTNVASTRVTLASFMPNKGTFGFCALQLGPDNRIYVARYGYNSLAYINDPNNGGGSCNYKTGTDAISLGNLLCKLGLPDFVSNFTATVNEVVVTEVDPCCPPWNADILLDLLHYEGSGSINDPYTLKFVETPLHNSLMQAYLDYVHSMNSAITNIYIAFRLHDRGTNALPNPSGGPQINPWNHVEWISGGGGTPIFGGAPFFAPSLMNVGTWYNVHTGIYFNNELKFFDDKCDVVDIFVRVQALHTSVPLLQISDGKTIIKTVPIK